MTDIFEILLPFSNIFAKRIKINEDNLGVTGKMLTFVAPKIK